MLQTQNQPAEAVSTQRLDWVEPLKAAALLWIYCNHVAERIFGSPYAGNPDALWPSLSERLHQFFGGGGFLFVALRDIAWLGDQGVSVFLIVSGLTLTWSCLSAGTPALSWKHFYKRRLLRLYPLWIAANLLLLFPFAIFGVRLSLLDARLYLSLIGVRVLPDQLYYGNSAWWFVTLLLQLYLVFPLLWTLLRRVRPMVFTLLVPGAALAIRALGLFAFHGYLDAWSRGAVFLTRLPEFALGMSFGMLLFGLKEQHRAAPARWQLLPPALLSLALGLAASFTLAGMIAAPLLMGAGAFLVFYCLFSNGFPLASLPDWIGRHSLSLFLVHQPFVRLFMPAGPPGNKLLPFFLRLLLTLALSVLAALLLERITARALSALKRGQMRCGGIPFARRFTIAFLCLWAALIAGDFAVRRFDPLEPQDLGWGERPSLQPDAEFGWKLHPLEDIRLRWISYDYQVHSNRLGFPGPEYPPTPAPGVQRILVTGDAFTSAEGVNTGNAWPRRLEAKLNTLSKGARTEVLNFAITGYGPNQYQQVVAHFVPIYHPNIVLIGLFINDYQDAITTTEAFQKSIGFSRPDPNGLAAILTFRQLSALVRAKLTLWIYRYLLRKPDPDGYFLGQFDQLEAGPEGSVAQGRATLARRLAEIKQCTDAAGARLLVVLIPSGPQVCTPAALAYWPKYTSLANPYFDVTLPQRTSQEIISRLPAESLDLLPSLRAMNTCPYQPENMHWTQAAHQLAADQIARVLSSQHAESN